MSPKECRDVFEMLSEYLDGELPEGTCEQIEQHIADCPPCVEFLKSLRKSVNLCRGYKPPEAPPPLSDDAKQRLTEAYRQMLARNKSTRSAQ
jgi:anti-sigma factor (TIGR02949 family)